MKVIIARYSNKINEKTLGIWREQDYPHESRILILLEYNSKDKKWYFWGLPDKSAISVNGMKRDFPMDFFKDLIRAKSFLLSGKGLHDDITIVKGGNYIGLNSE